MGRRSIGMITTFGLLTSENTSYSWILFLNYENTIEVASVNESRRKQWPRCFYVLAILLGILASELMARGAYYVLYNGQRDRLIQAFIGSAGGYNPNMVSNY